MMGFRKIEFPGLAPGLPSGVGKAFRKTYRQSPEMDNA